MKQAAVSFMLISDMWGLTVLYNTQSLIWIKHDQAESDNIELE